MSDRGLDMWRTAGCCGRGGQVTRITVSEKGYTVGIVGLRRIFEQLVATGQRLVEDTADELLAMVKTRNYVPSSAEEEYRTALLREYAAFQALRETRY
ncbi:MAG: hypothetical protein PVF54_05190 [Anaerolineae bacterium]|jgi:hypothetical protein